MFLLVIPGVILVGLSFLRWQFGSGDRRAKNIVLAGICMIIVGAISLAVYNDRHSTTVVTYPVATLRATDLTEELGIAGRSGTITEVAIRSRPTEPSSQYVGVFEDPQQAMAVTVTIVVSFRRPGQNAPKMNYYYVAPELLELKYGPRTAFHMKYQTLGAFGEVTSTEWQTWYRTNSGQWKAVDPAWSNSDPKFWDEHQMLMMEADDIPSGNPLVMP